MTAKSVEFSNVSLWQQPQYFVIDIETKKNYYYVDFLAKILKEQSVFAFYFFIELHNQFQM
jgi:hypothetical protein